MPTTDLQLVAVSSETEKFAYRTPMKFGGRVVEDVTLVNIRCRASIGGGEPVEGIGSMTMGTAWAWPSKKLSAEQVLATVVRLSRDLVAEVSDAIKNRRVELTRADHAMDLCAAIHPLVDLAAERLRVSLDLPESIPALARLLAFSPLQSAIFDAHGRGARLSCYAMMGPEYLKGDLSRFLGDEFTGQNLDRYVQATPAESMPLYHLVGALDPLVSDEVQSPLADGLPETLGEWIERDGLTHLKIKLDGSDGDWDLARIRAIDRVVESDSRWRDRPWQYSLDFNERCRDEDYVLRLLDALQQTDPQALSRIAYIEQPTHRDLRAHPENTMHRVSQRLPVVIDESLIDYESLLLARDQGYTGVAIKACKGHADALLMAAAAGHHQMFLCVQDLTCVGRSFLHSASLTAHLPAASAIEGNGRQYCPAANRGWDQRFPGMFDVRDGRLPTALLDGPGLGY
jgi:L-alanine-DL-glutamate epimerase-like enolase superfamily enzyme